MEHFRNTALFKSFFPYLVAGPIVKAHEFYPQIEAKNLQDIAWETAFRCLVVGYFLKMVVADNLKDATFWIEYPHFLRHSSVGLLALLFGFSMQIFADFAGYSLIAIGLGHLFGYNLPTNFNFPYLSRSFSEFWKRWHISLSTWLRDYLYFPLGGNRKGKIRTYLNLFIVMFLGGLWHGASWKYAVWGSFHGLALAVERLFRNKINLPRHWVLDSLRVLVVFSFVTFAWLLFRLPTLKQVYDYLGRHFQRRGRNALCNCRVRPDLLRTGHTLLCLASAEQTVASATAAIRISNPGRVARGHCLEQRLTAEVHLLPILGPA